ncbi:MAG: hypothetical protein U0168_31680 [Nannocystaceae bacterium]
MSGDLLDGLVTDARASLERARRAVPPDFAAVLAKARAEQPDLPAMPPSLDDADDEPGADVVDIRQRPRTAAGPDPVDDLVAGARGSIERMIDARRLRPIPPMPRPAAPRRRLAMVVGAAGLLAAALVATFAGIRWVEQAQRLEDEAAREQAAQVGQAQPDAPADVVDVVVEPERPRARPVAPPPEAEPQLAIEPESEIVASPERPSKPAVEPDRLRAPPSRRARCGAQVIAPAPRRSSSRSSTKAAARAWPSSRGATCSRSRGSRVMMRDWPSVGARTSRASPRGATPTMRARACVDVRATVVSAGATTCATSRAAAIAPRPARASRVADASRVDVLAAAAGVRRSPTSSWA